MSICMAKRNAGTVTKPGIMYYILQDIISEH